MAVLTGNWQEYHERYLALLQAGGGLTDHNVWTAFSRVPRHLFCPSRFSVFKTLLPGKKYIEYELDYDHAQPREEALAVIYGNYAVDQFESGRRLVVGMMQPLLVSDMLTALDVRPGMTVLEIGTGTGYVTALLAELCGPGGRVISIEPVPDLAAKADRILQSLGYEQVTSIGGDATGDLPVRSVDRVLSSLSLADLPPPVLKSLEPGGRASLVMHHRGFEFLMYLERDERGLAGRFDGRSHETASLVWADHVDQFRVADGREFERRLGPGQPMPDHPSLSVSDLRRGWFPFLALASPLTHRLVPGDRADSAVTVALVDKELGAAVSHGLHGWYSHGPPSLVHEFNRLFTEWCELGQPRLDEYVARIEPRGNQGLPDPGFCIPRIWNTETAVLGGGNHELP